MINETNLERAKRLIRESKEKPLIVKAQDQVFNRKIIEYGKFDIILGIEKNVKSPGIRHQDSGMNEIIGRIASKKNISIGIDIKEIDNLDKKNKAIELSKIKQNIKICRKTKTNINLINYKDGKDASALLISLGASTPQANKAISF